MPISSVKYLNFFAYISFDKSIKIPRVLRENHTFIVVIEVGTVNAPAVLLLEFYVLILNKARLQFPSNKIAPFFLSYSMVSRYRPCFDLRTGSKPVIHVISHAKTFFYHIIYGPNAQLIFKDRHDIIRLTKAEIQ